MNQLIKLTVFTTLSFMTLTGCSTDNPQNSAIQESNLNDTADKDMIESPTENQVVYFGKVKRVIGNEVELELAKEPFDSVEEELGSEDVSEGAAGGGMVASSTIVASTITSSTDMPKIELEYTGETKSMVIPTGTPIKDKGAEGNLSALKEGSVVMIFASEEGEDSIVSSVDIWE